MLVLSRKSRESVVIGGADGFNRMLKVTVLDIRGGKVRLGFEADSDVPVHRLEVWERLRAEAGETPDKAPAVCCAAGE
ncbi:MAG: carbon storage regulator [Pirellulales bacterium]